MAYQKQNWKNLPDQSTPITADRLNHMEDGIEDAYNFGGETFNEYSESKTGSYSCEYINKNLNNSDSYSTSETKTNQIWIDGKPLYRRTYIISNPGTGEWSYDNNLPHDIAFFDMSHTGMLRSNGTVYSGIGEDGNSPYWFQARGISSVGNLLFYVGSAVASGSTIYATILYTKKED